MAEEDKAYYEDVLKKCQGFNTDKLNIQAIINETYNSAIGKLCRDLTFIMKNIGVDDERIQRYLLYQLGLVNRLNETQFQCGINITEEFSKLYQSKNF